MHPTTFPASVALAFVVAATPASPIDAIQDSIAEGVILREDIPDGIEVHEFNATDFTAVIEQADGTSINPAALLKRSDCKGSGLCGQTSASQCRRALSVREK